MTTSDATIEDLLQTTSRTFALSIPLLPAPLNREITLAYLVFRIADTLEDAEHLNRDRRREALRTFGDLLRKADGDSGCEEAEFTNWANEWQGISTNEDYNRLVAESSRVLTQTCELEGNAPAIVFRHAVRSVDGMADTLAKADEAGNLTLQSVDELQEYCYYVAGIVGEMITELFLEQHRGSHDSMVNENAKMLFQTAPQFGESLQLVNILKDSNDDQQCGRAYLPAQVPREEIFKLARNDLEEANRYVATLRQMDAAPGMIAFCDAPLQLADATLRVVAEHGPGSKVPRDETFALLQQVMERAGICE